MDDLQQESTIREHQTNPDQIAAEDNAPIIPQTSNMETTEDGEKEKSDESSSQNTSGKDFWWPLEHHTNPDQLPAQDDAPIIPQTSNMETTEDGEKEKSDESSSQNRSGKDFWWPREHQTNPDQLATLDDATIIPQTSNMETTEDRKKEKSDESSSQKRSGKDFWWPRRRLKNIDRSSGQTTAVTVNNVTVFFTEYKLKTGTSQDEFEQRNKAFYTEDQSKTSTDGQNNNTLSSSSEINMTADGQNNNTLSSSSEINMNAEGQNKNTLSPSSEINMTADGQNKNALYSSSEIKMTADGQNNNTLSPSSEINMTDSQFLD